MSMYTLGCFSVYTGKNKHNGWCTANHSQTSPEAVLSYAEPAVGILATLCLQPRMHEGLAVATQVVNDPSG